MNGLIQFYFVIPMPAIHRSINIGEKIRIGFNNPNVLIRSPVCPDFFEWRGHTFFIKTLLSEWKDFSRKGRSARNMSAPHRNRAVIKGSRGVGRFFFRVVSDSGRIFELYYDRAPLNIEDRLGEWILFQELLIEEKN